MQYIESFSRVEDKYLLTKTQKEEIEFSIKPHIKPDIYSKYSLTNIYCDSNDYQMTITSAEKPTYKEKLRVRKYSGDDTKIFIEVKKKYNGIVYKRRVSEENLNYEKYLLNPSLIENSQIGRELGWVIRSYNAVPKILVSYDRSAFAAVIEPDVRVTFDTNIQYRNHDLEFKKTNVCNNILLNDDSFLMEIKVMNRYPIWLTEALTKVGAKRISYSKVGNAYKELLLGGKI